MAENTNNPKFIEMQPVKSPKSTDPADVVEKQELFQVLQGNVTDEQLEEWNKMNQETSHLVQQSLSAQSGVQSEIGLQLPAAKDVQTNLSETAGGSGTAATGTLSESHVWNMLDLSNTIEKSEEEHADNQEVGIESASDLADATSRVSALATLQKQSASDSDDFSAFCLETPEILAKYLTGKMTLEELRKVVEEKKAKKAKGARNRKRKVDDDYVYEEENDFVGEEDDEFETDDEENEENVDENEEDEGDDWLLDPTKSLASDSKDGKVKKARRRRWEVPKSMHHLMGEITNQMSSGNTEQAAKLCCALIQRAPKASAPYETLSIIYDEQGMADKAREYLLMAAYLKRVDAELWLSVAKRMQEHNNLRKAAECYTQAIKAISNNMEKVELMQDRCLLYEQMNDMPKALMGYAQMLTYIDANPENDEKYLKLARKLCESYHNMKRTNDAARILTTMFTSRPSLINSDDVNKLLDLRMIMKQYQSCLEGLVNYCGVEVTLQDGTKWQQETSLPTDCDLKATPGIILSVKVPENLPTGFPVDLLTKLCCCLISLGCGQKAKHLVELLLNENVDENENGDLFLDLVDAYMETDQCSEALPILKRCVTSANYSEALVWLRYGECLNTLGQLAEAVEAFSNVVELAPDHLGARVSLSALQQQIGRHDDALEVLSGNKDKDGNSEEGILDDQTLLMHKCHLLFSQKRKQEFLVASRRLLFSYFHEMYKPGYLKIVFGYRSLKHRTDALRTYMKGQSADHNLLKESESKKDKSSDSKKEDRKVNGDELWDLYLKMCEILLEEKKLDELSEVSLLGLTCPAFNTDPVKVKNAEFLCLTVCLMTKNGEFAYNFIKEICIKDPQNTMAWNLFCQTLIHTSEIRHHKFCLRRLMQWPDNISLGVLNGHNSLQNGSYRSALGEYTEVLRRKPTEPLIHLCIGLCYVHIACQKFTSRKDWLVLQGIAFLNSYLSLRGKCQETYYNIGRAMHQLDLSYAAMYYYKQALSIPPPVESENGTFDLKREIAFNLSLIYKKSGNIDLARVCYETYLIV